MEQWRFVYDEYDTGQEGRREALCALGNGLFVTLPRRQTARPTTSTILERTSPAATTG